MIIELFGAAASGKTTLARALTNALRNDGCDVGQVMSSRPAEGEGIGHTMLTRSLSRAKKVAGVFPVLVNRNAPVADRLMDLLPPSGLLRTVRLRRYLAGLEQSWKQAENSDCITIFDQGYVSALCSLAMYARLANARILAKGLKILPRPDLLVVLSAPVDVLGARLRNRNNHQGVLERMFEMDQHLCKKQAALVLEITALLPRQSWAIVETTCLDAETLSFAVKRITQMVFATTAGPQEQVHV